MVDRRHFIKKAAGSLAALGGLTLLQRSGLAAATGAEESTVLDALPGKGTLIKKPTGLPTTKLRSIISTHRLHPIISFLCATITP